MKLLDILRKLGLIRENGIFYIGGSDVLPPPLKGAEELLTLQALEQGDEDARQRLVEHNLRLVVYIARRFENTGVNLEDLISTSRRLCSTSRCRASSSPCSSA